jgi:hypothetical protein
MNLPLNRPYKPPIEPGKSTIPRPSKPKKIIPETLSSSSTQSVNIVTTETQTTSNDPPEPRQQPIPAPSNPKQYRAIGLVKGTYQPNQEQITQGTLISSEGKIIDAVLLGKTIGLVKKHLNLDKEHLWVVYPRTRPNEPSLHVQIVGVWEPETLAKELILNNSLTPIPQKNGYFSIRGEIVFYDREQKIAIVKIKQSPRKESDKIKFFKLNLKGNLPDKPIHHFWDLKVELEGEDLVIKQATNLGFISNKTKPSRKAPFGKKFPPKTGFKKDERSFIVKPESEPRNSPRPILKPKQFREQ